MLNFTCQLQVGLRPFLRSAESHGLAHHLVAELLDLRFESTVVETKLLHLSLKIQKFRLQ